jgi:hypothetical protein
MKLYSLVKHQPTNNYSTNNLTNKSLFLIGATLIIVIGGFFYSQSSQAKISNIPNTSDTSHIINDELEKIFSPEKQLLSANISSQKTPSPKKVKKNKQTKVCSSSSISLQQINKNDFKKIQEKIKQNQTEDNLKKQLNLILSGTPMEKMIEPISQQDKLIAAFLVGIALKESQLGKHSPKLNGQDCFNYWGYRGKRVRMGTGGHTCFDSPEDAVETVAKRLQTLAIAQHRNTPDKMIIWKCGNSCANHSPESVSKWIKDVSIYFNKIKNS